MWRRLKTCNHGASQTCQRLSSNPGCLPESDPGIASHGFGTSSQSKPPNAGWLRSTRASPVQFALRSLRSSGANAWSRVPSDDARSQFPSDVSLHSQHAFWIPSAYRPSIPCVSVSLNSNPPHARAYALPCALRRLRRLAFDALLLSSGGFGSRLRSPTWCEQAFACSARVSSSACRATLSARLQTCRTPSSLSCRAAECYSDLQWSTANTPHSGLRALPFPFGRRTRRRRGYWAFRLPARRRFWIAQRRRSANVQSLFLHASDRARCASRWTLPAHAWATALRPSRACTREWDPKSYPFRRRRDRVQPLRS